MKMRLARRLMRSATPETLPLDKETLITFALQDVPGSNLTDNLFHLPAPDRDKREYQTSRIMIDVDQAESE
jgi:hypothetical protein